MMAMPMMFVFLFLLPLAFTLFAVPLGFFIALHVHRLWLHEDRLRLDIDRTRLLVDRLCWLV